MASCEGKVDIMVPCMCCPIRNLPTSNANEKDFDMTLVHDNKNFSILKRFVPCKTMFP